MENQAVTTRTGSKDTRTRTWRVRGQTPCKEVGFHSSLPPESEETETSPGPVSSVIDGTNQSTRVYFNHNNYESRILTTSSHKVAGITTSKSVEE